LLVCQGGKFRRGMMRGERSVATAAFGIAFDIRHGGCLLLLLPHHPVRLLLRQRRLMLHLH